MSRRVATPPRIVLDSNVLVSALVFGGGTSAQMRRAWQSRLFTPLASVATAQELIRVLAYPKFGLSAAEQLELLADYLPWAATVHVPMQAPVVPTCRDPFDLPFLHLAVSGKMATLVSGDKDLLVLDGRLPCPVITPAALLATLPA